MRADDSYEGGVYVSPEKFLPTNKVGRVPRPQIPINRIKNPFCVDQAGELSQFFGSDMIPLWFLKTFEMSANPDTFHGEYYRKDISMQFAWCPIYLPDKKREYTIFYTVVNMIDYCERLLETYNNLPSKIETILRDIQDRFAPLSIHMEMKNCFTNREIMQGDQESGCSPFDVYRPRKELSFTIESLPDLFIHIYHCGYWGGEQEEVFDGLLDTKILSFLKKLIPNPCKSRSLTEIISEVWLDRSNKKSKKRLSKEDANIFFDINVRLVMAGLLGIYDHCKSRANLQVRRRIYRWFCMSFPGKEEFSSWFNENPYLILYIMREFLFFGISHITSLKEFMESHYYWSFLTSNTFDSMDYARKYANEHMGLGFYVHPVIDLDGDSILGQYSREKLYYSLRGEKDLQGSHYHPYTSWYSGVHDYMFQSNKTCLSYTNRSMEKNFVDKVVEIILRADCEEDNKKGKYRKRISPENKYGEIFTKQEEEKLEDMINEFNVFGSNHYSYGWLIRRYKMREKSLRKLEEAEMLMTTETSRSKLKKVLYEIKEKEPYDYAIIRCLFLSFKKKFGITFHNLPRFLLKKQVETMNRLYEVPNGERLPEMAGLYYICTSCGEIKAPVVGNRDQKKKDLSIERGGDNWEEEKIKQENKEENTRELSMYFRNIAMDTGTGKLYCYVKKNKDNHDKDYALNDPDYVQVAKKRKTNSQDVTMQIIGGKKKKKAKKQKMDADGNIIPEEENEEENNNNSNRLKMLYMSTRCSSRPLKPFNVLGQLVTTEKTGPCFLCPYCASLSTYGRRNMRDSDGHISCGCMQVDFKWRFRCELCEKTAIKRIYMRWVFDDEVEEKKIRPAVMCRKHRLAQVKKYKGILLLSKLKEVIRNNLFIYTLDDGSQYFSSSKTSKNILYDIDQ